MTVRHIILKLCDYRHVYVHHKLALLTQPKYAGMVHTEQFQLADVNARKSGDVCPLDKSGYSITKITHYVNQPALCIQNQDTSGTVCYIQYVYGPA